jgi:adenylosuccinate synthase
LITTFMDMLINQFKEEKRGGKRHGSCGVGFHETIVRSRVPELKITMSDLWNGGTGLETQLAEICGKYAKFRIGGAFPFNPLVIQKFIECCADFAQCVNPLGMAQCKDPVFEGSQGLLLDMDNKEFFPHVTHSNTGMKNVDILCAQAGITEIEPWYVSRTYLTRHGAGPLPGEESSLSFEDNTNHKTQFQGQLRFAPLDGGLRSRCGRDAGRRPWKLAFTHCDQLGPDILADLYADGPTRNSVSADIPKNEAITV